MTRKIMTACAGVLALALAGYASAQQTQAPVTPSSAPGEQQQIVVYDQYTLEEISGALAPAEAAPVTASQQDQTPEYDQYTWEEIAGAFETPPPPTPLPATASPYYLLGAAGVLSTLAGLILKRARA